MITIEQCRGARGLLGWTQQDLADASGLSKTAINNFEKGYSDIKTESLRAIRMAFESVNIEFLGDEGLRKRVDHARLLKGANALALLLEDIHETLRNAGGDVLISHVDQALSNRITTERLFEHLEIIKTRNIRERVLCAPGLKSILSPQDECRWLSHERLRSGQATFLYGKKAAFELWDHSMIIIVNSAEAYQAERRRFELLWAGAQIPAEDSSEQNSDNSVRL